MHKSNYFFCQKVDENEEAPPKWFSGFMEKYREEIVAEVTSKVSTVTVEKSAVNAVSLCIFLSSTGEISYLDE